MDIDIKVPDLLKKPMIEFYTHQLRELDIKAHEIHQQMQAIAELLDKLQNLPTTSLSGQLTFNNPANGLNGYHKEWTWGQKISYFIKKEGRPLATGEIADLIVSDAYEPELRPTRNKVVGSVSSVLTSEKGQKSYKLLKNELGQRVYTLKGEAYYA